MFDWVLNTPLINYHWVLTLKSMLSFKLLSFDFSLKKNFTLLTMLVKHALQNGKWYRKKLSLIQSKELTEISTVQLPAVFNFHEWQYWISSGLSRPKKILSTTNKFPSNGFLVHLYVKNKCKVARKDTCEMGHVSPPYTYRKLCQSAKPDVF